MTRFRRDNDKGRLRNLSVLFLFCLLSSLVLSGCDFKLPWSDESETETTIENVKGLADVPEFPEATFMFEDYEDTEEVRGMLAQGRSAYRMPEGTEFEDVVLYYQAELDAIGWSHELSIEDDDEDHKPGEYWSKGDLGLRIYTWLNDIWYETLTATEAKTGLEDRVAYEKQVEWKEENLLVDLDVGYPFKLRYPKSWEVFREEAIYSNGYDLVFESPEQGYVNKIQDLGGIYEQSLESIALEHLGKVNEKRSNSSQLIVERREELFISGTDALELVLDVQGEDNWDAAMCFLVNPKDNRVYVLVNLRGDANFYGTMKSNLELNNDWGEEDDDE